ncbi:hypothetical protein BOTBODRAFT_52361 [Botryobasidium botryosum FD-172 SS1]|uniref:Symplekin/Pta1 N-terminal domain-containing protein n=1 Tax=Botryobasidium botryosum (strain FD-172 SS1) TaxID=930990 RepID=A0A067N2C9_BOTB1|nr:hypothetical protein BOTBODRAFT_52361 [Botryobasidium botryosum FD-172 SS1]
MAMSEEAQKATLNDIYSRSLHQPRGQAARRQALIKIIQLTRSPFPSVKKESSQVLGTFFEEFPDIQDQVVDAVYDLCEDSNPEVRLDGYKVIVELSKRVKTWTRRNTDVLIQLLQSEDIVELGVVKRSLLEHIKNDPEGALGVMCDYCIGSSDAPDTALKGLVINFLLYDAKSEREKILSSVPEPEAAKTLRAGLVQSIPRADIVQLPIILNDLLFPPPARSPAGLLPAALEALMAQSGLVLDQELPTSPTLPDTMLHLSLASGLLRQPGDPTHLLRFLTGRIVPLSMDLTVLAKLEPDTRFMLVSHTTEVFKTCRSKANSATAWPELLALRNKMTDVGNVWPDVGGSSEGFDFGSNLPFQH